MSRVTFSNNGIFYRQLKKKVDLYFKEKNKKRTGNWKLYSKAIIFITTAVALYILLLSGKCPIMVSLVLCSLLGFTLAGIGFNIMHDACHGSFSSKKWINQILGFSLNALGGNSYIWKCKHYTHHTFTNVDGMDDDIAKSPLLRQCDSQKWLPFHRYQYIYIIFLYAISCLAWITIMDFNKYFRQKISATPLKKMSLMNHFIFWISKSMYVFFYALVPIYYVGFEPWLIGFTTMQITTGYTLALVFQLAHVVQKTSFESVPLNPKQVQGEWALLQLTSTADFSARNKFLSWYVGGLNFQIEHHLFPWISHIHYPAISKIVRSTCLEFNLPYNYFSTMSEAIISHFVQMKKLGRKPFNSNYINNNAEVVFPRKNDKIIYKEPY